VLLRQCRQLLPSGRKGVGLFLHGPVLLTPTISPRSGDPTRLPCRLVQSIDQHVEGHTIRWCRDSSQQPGPDPFRILQLTHVVHQGATALFSALRLSYVIQLRFSALLVHRRFSALKAPQTLPRKTDFQTPCSTSRCSPWPVLSRKRSQIQQLNGSRARNLGRPSAALSHWPAHPTRPLASWVRP